jgi:hypothetical protein
VEVLVVAPGIDLPVFGPPPARFGGQSKTFLLPALRRDVGWYTCPT